MRKIYRVKHKPSGFYYKPLSGTVGSHLGERGKVYTTASNGVLNKETGPVYIQIRKNSKIHKKLEELGYTPSGDNSGTWKAIYYIPRAEFEKEYLTNIEDL